MKPKEDGGDYELSFGVVGAGSIGSALGGLIQASGRNMSFWDVDSTKCTVPSLSDLVASSDVIFICVRTAVLEAVANEVAAAVGNKRRLVVTVAKGVTGGFKIPDQILRGAAKDRCDVGVFYGPMLATEVRQQGRLAGVLAVSGSSWTGCLDGVFGGQSRVEYTNRVLSIAVCGVLKNIYSVTFGLAAGLNWGYNDRSRLMVAVMDEFRWVLAELGGDPADADGLAGLGDLLATGSSELSFNYRAGLAVAVGESPKGEGINSLREISSALDVSGYPILRLLSAIVFDRAEPAELWRVVASQEVVW